MTTEANGYRYEIAADIEAPAAEVWQAWTDARRYEAWSRAVPGSVELDVRPGGKWAAAMTGPDGEAFPLTGSYLDVVPNERIDMAMDVPGGEPEVMRMDVTDLGEGRSRLTISQTCSTREAHDQSKEGSQMLLDWCVEYLTGA